MSFVANDIIIIIHDALLIATPWGMMIIIIITSDWAFTIQWTRAVTSSIFFTRATTCGALVSAYGASTLCPSRTLTVVSSTATG